MTDAAPAAQATLRDRLRLQIAAPSAFGPTSILTSTWVPIHLQREIVLHEIIHACVFGGRFDGELADDADHEEYYISGVDAPLLATLRDNPDLVAYLTA